MIIKDNIFKGLTIQADEERGYGCYEDILKKIYDLMVYYTSKHNKVLFIRFDVRFPQGIESDPTNKTFRDFIAGLAKHYSRLDRDPVYIWVREGSGNGNQHYHCVLLLNGNKAINASKVIWQADRLWCIKTGNGYPGLVYNCMKARDGSIQSNGIMLRRHDDNFVHVFEHCFHWASYLAKVTSKTCTQPWIREFCSSRIPKDWQIHPKVQDMLKY